MFKNTKEGPRIPEMFEKACRLLLAFRLNPLLSRGIPGGRTTDDFGNSNLTLVPELAVRPPLPKAVHRTLGADPVGDAPQTLV